MHEQSDSFFGSVVTYSIAFGAYFVDKLDLVVQWVGDVNWMAVGAGILLLARLAQDVPKAIISIRKFIKGETK